MKKQMTRDEILKYLEQFDGRYFSTKGRNNADVEMEVRTIVKKMATLVKKAGFEVHLQKPSFGHSATYYRYPLDENGYKYIEVYLGYSERKSKPYGRKQVRYTNGYQGIFTHREGGVSLNPSTGRPWQIGDVKYHESGCYSTILTSRGWWSGD